MTTEDIKQVQITIISNDGRVLVGYTDSPILTAMIVSEVKFVELDADKVAFSNLKEYTKCEKSNTEPE